MGSLTDMIWVEWRKALRSRMPLWTALGSLFMPFGIAFLLFVSKNPEVSKKLGLVSAKANLVAYSATDWTTYLTLYGQLIAAGGFFLFILIISWMFGREFSDRTVKDLLAVPVQRSSIILSKYIVMALWSAALAVLMVLTGLVMGTLLGLPGAAPELFAQHSLVLAITSLLVIAVVLPFAFFASVGRGYLLPIGLAILALMTANLSMVVGRAEFFPWAIPGLYAEGKNLLTPASYWIVLLTGALGIFATYWWWKYADQNR